MDFDGVLHQWDGEWKGYGHVGGPPIEGAIFWLFTLLQDFDVTILTTRGRSWRGRRAVRRWLKQHAGMMWNETIDSRGLEDIKVSAVKAPALVYIDDRAHRYEGGKFPSVERLRAMRPWWKSR